ncbi:MAG: tetratricopeptide repeat protein, partial [Planctomycetes bacterium]|nr:tetratricopeptide repeat protein [Planctomycetota bacterium]
MGHDPSDPPSGASGTRLERARLRHARSREALQAGDLKAAARHATEGVRLLTGAAEPPPEGAGAELSGAELAGVPTAGPEAAEAALLLANLAFCESALARNEAALSVIREAHRIADGCPDPEVLARVARIEGDIFGNAGRYLLARSRHEVARTLFHTLGNPLEEAMVLHNMGNDSAEQGRVSEAIGCFRDALPLFQEARAPRKEAMTLGCLAYARFQAGEWAESEAAFERLSASAGTFGDRRFESMVRRWRGELRLEQGRLEEAR